MHECMHTAGLPIGRPAYQLVSWPAPPLLPLRSFLESWSVQHCFIVSVCPLWQTPGTPHRMQSDNVGRLTQRLLHRVGKCPLPGTEAQLMGTRQTTQRNATQHDTTQQGARPLLCCVVLCRVVSCCPPCVHPCVGPVPRRISSLPLFVRLIDMTAEYTPHHNIPDHAMPHRMAPPDTICCAVLCCVYYPPGTETATES